jgi:large repetitive protein
MKVGTKHKIQIPQYNEVFFIRDLPVNARLIIFDRSGRKVYTSNNYQNDWNGKDDEGQSLETGTYWYVLSLPGFPTELKGFVYIKK